MDLNIKYFKLIISLMILFIIFPQTIQVLSFTFPQSITLGNDNTGTHNIIVVEKNGIYMCDPSLNNIEKTLYTFPEEDRITTKDRLSKTLLKKSSVAIFIFSNYKLYLLDTKTGELLNKNFIKIITDDEPEYVALSPVISLNILYFIIGYIDKNNYLKIKLYKCVNNNKSFNQLGVPNSLNSVSRKVSRTTQTLNFKNKGLSCDYITDVRSSSKGFFTCFLIGSNGSNEYLIPVIFQNQKENIILFDDTYQMDSIQVNNNKIIKSDTNVAMTISYVCYITEENKGRCGQFSLDEKYQNRYAYGYFNSLKDFDKKCRADMYGMKVSYIFETGKVLFSCSDLDGSLQIYSFTDNKDYTKYSPCTNIYGYSVIYLNSLDNYYIISDVTCPQGKIPYDILIEQYGYSPEYVAIDIDTTYQEVNFDSTSVSSTMIISKILTDKIIKSTLIEKIPETEKIEIKDCPEMCLECNSQKKCTKCNKIKNYFPIELATSPEANPSQIVECLTEEIKKIKYPNFYFDPKSESFKSCYYTCATCNGHGEGNNNNCTTCEPGYEPHPEYDDDVSKNCVSKRNIYYYIYYGQYTITNSDRCPEDFSFLVEEKGKCIEDCKKDTKYKYTHDGLCFESPPENTNDEDGDFICKDNPNTCVIKRKRLYSMNYTITDKEIEILTFKYAKEFNYTNNHITIYENDIYIISIYKNGECFTELGILYKTIDFKTCYTDIQKKYDISQDTNLIVVLIETKPGKEEYKKIPSYGLYHPETGISFNFEIECKEQKIIIQSNISQELNDSKVSLGDIRVMAENGLDLFDPSCPFYNDLCTHYPDILNRDIPLKKRILAYYPDIELCDDNCETSHIFLNNLTVKCECPISEEESRNDKFRDNALYQNELGDLEELIYSTNINVIKCYHDLFKIEYFKKCYGGIIILVLIFIQIICTIIYCTKSKFYLKKFFFSITSKYLNYLKNKNLLKNLRQIPPPIKVDIPENNFPPRKKNKSLTAIDVLSKNKNQPNLIINNNFNSRKSQNIIILDKNSKNLNTNTNSSKKRKKNSKSKTLKRKSLKHNSNYNLSLEQSASDNLMNNIKDDLDIYIEDYLKTDPEDMDYDDALRRDKRPFCTYYFEKIQSEQIILNTFFYKEYLKPMPIKIMLLVLQIELYFFINGLFYNEEYVTKIFDLEKDSFSEKAWRFLDNLFYAFLVGVIINFFIEFFFIEEKKIRTTLKREKDNLLILQYEMTRIIKDIQTRFLSFIIITFIISVFIWNHISCFNNIYKHMKEEWLIFSVLIIVCILIISLITTLIETILRFLSFRFKSEKLFKLSVIFS